VEIHLLDFSQDIMLNSFPARFEAVAASLTASFQPEKIHFNGEYHSISENCAQHGRSLVLDGIQDLTQFNIPERITDQSRKVLTSYRMRFLLPSSSTTR
jgi:hypothetical protein